MSNFQKKYYNAAFVTFFWVSSFVLPLQSPFASESSFQITLLFGPFFILGILAVPKVLKSKISSDLIVWVYIPTILVTISLIFRYIANS